MKLKEYLEQLNALVKNRPEVLEMLLIHSTDDEGNDYKHVNFTPEVVEVEDTDSHFLELIDEGGIEVLCIN